MPVEMSVFAPQEGKLLFQIKATGISPAKGRKSILLQHHRKTVDMVFFPVTSVLLYNVISTEGAMLEHLSIAMDATLALSARYNTAAMSERLLAEMWGQPPRAIKV